MINSTEIKKQFLIFPNGKNVNQLKNEVDKHIRSLKKSGSSNIPKKNDLLNKLSREMTGLTYNKAVSDLKAICPYIDGVDNLVIPFAFKEGIAEVSLLTLDDLSDNPALKKSIGEIRGTEAWISVKDMIIIQDYLNIERIEDGWKINLYITEQAKALDGYSEDDQSWIEVKNIGVGVSITHYTTEYCPELDGYNVNSGVTTCAFIEELFPEPINKAELVNIDIDNKLMSMNIEDIVKHFTGYSDLKLKERNSRNERSDTRIYMFLSKNNADMVAVKTEPNYIKIDSMKNGILYEGSMEELK